MTWGNLHFSDGGKIPEIAWGSWKRTGDVAGQTEQAIEAGFNHIDTAQAYANEGYVGQGIHSAVTNRSEVFVTTKWSGKDGKGIRESLDESLKALNLKYVDLYLIHSPRLTNGDHVGKFGEMEWLVKEGYVRYAGVSNFEVSDLEELRAAGCNVAANQIFLTPSVYEKQRLLIEYHRAHGIVTEAYSVLRDLTEGKGGAVDKAASKIAARLHVEPSQVLLAWARAKGVVIVTSSTSKEHLREMMKAGDVRLSKEDEQTIDEAGKKARFCFSFVAKRALAGLATLAATAVLARRYCH